MERLSYFLWLLFCLTSSVSAWSFTWRNKDGDAYVEHSEKPYGCTKINHAKGQVFRYNPEDNEYDIRMWSNADCSGTQSGWSPNFWEKESSVNLLSFMVGSEDDEEDESTTSPTPTPSTVTSETETPGTGTPETETPTPTPAPIESQSPTPTPSNEPSSSSSISGGAIGGIVIGAVAGLALVGGLFFFLGRRGKSAAAPDVEPQESLLAPDLGHPPPSASASAPPPPFFAAEMKPELDATPITPRNEKHEFKGTFKPPIAEVESPMTPQYTGAPAWVLAELPGDYNMMEMSDTHRLNEMEGRGLPKR